MEFVKSYGQHILVGLVAAGMILISLWKWRIKKAYRSGWHDSQELNRRELLKLRKETIRLRSQNDDLITIISGLIQEGKIPVIKINQFDDTQNPDEDNVIRIEKRPAEAGRS